MRLTTLRTNTKSPGRLHREYLRKKRFAFSGPGREVPALADFCVEPQLLEFWKLKKSFARTRASNFIIYWGGIERAIKTIRHSAVRPLSPRQRYVCLTVVALLLIPLPNPLQSLREDARRWSSNRCGYKLHRVLLVIAVAHTAKRRHSRSESPEIPGRTIFFVVATGRSPPSVVAVPPG